MKFLTTKMKLIIIKTKRKQTKEKHEPQKENCKQTY